jgi:glycosyltransferase involved in cell wall biosynthesis
LRVLQINLCRAIGGSAIHYADLSLGLAERGCTMLVADRLGNFSRQQTGDCVEHLPMARGAFHATLAKAIRHFRPDIIHAHQRLASRIANRLKHGVPVISTIHNAYNARSYGRSDGVIRVADHQKPGMGSYHGPSITIRNWLRHTPCDASPPEAIRAEFGLNNGNFLFGTASRIVAGKGIFDLILAFRTIADPRARLLIVGTGRDMPRARRKAGDDRRIIFAGHRQDAPRLMRGMDAFVMASHRETLPLVLIEAATAGCALIATETAGAREVLDGMPVSFVPVRDAPALANSMQQAFRTFSGEHKRIEYDLSPFDRERQIDETLVFYESVLNSRKAA